jgi:hypothetical protein
MALYRHSVAVPWNAVTIPAGTGSLDLLGIAVWFWHPLTDSVSPSVMKIIVIVFLTSEAISFFVGVFAVATSRHKGLWPWVATNIFYYPLATLAAYKALWEMIAKPFFWDKTSHGQSAPVAPVPPRAIGLKPRLATDGLYRRLS